MSKQLLIGIISAAVILLAAVILIVIKVTRRRRLPNLFKDKWLEVQRLCTKRDTWTLAVINADKLLELALKKKHIKGKSMGEKLVSIQKVLSDNDGVWYAHNLAKKLLADAHLPLREAQAKKSLVGIRQALRDLGVLNGR